MNDAGGRGRVVRGNLYALVSVCFFGFSFLFTKNITEEVSALTLLSWRYLTALIVMSILIAFRVIRIDLKGKSLKPLLTIAVLVPVIYFIGETYGIQMTTASESGCIVASIPAVTMLASALILKQMPTGKMIAGIAITITGVVVCVLSKGMSVSFNPLGYLMLIMAVVSYALYGVFSRKEDSFTSVEKTYVMMALGAVVFTVLAVCERLAAGGGAASLAELAALPVTSRMFLVTILYTGIGCSVISFLLQNLAIEMIGPTKTVAYAGITTLISIVSGIVILGENFTMAQVIGAALIIGGVYIVNKIGTD